MATGQGKLQEVQRGRMEHNDRIRPGSSKIGGVSPHTCIFSGADSCWLSTKSRNTDRNFHNLILCLRPEKCREGCSSSPLTKLTTRTQTSQKLTLRSNSEETAWHGRQAPEQRHTAIVCVPTNPSSEDCGNLLVKLFSRGSRARASKTDQGPRKSRFLCTSTCRPNWGKTYISYTMMCPCK